jgi:hypothetical protein
MSSARSRPSVTSFLEIEPGAKEREHGGLLSQAMRSAAAGTEGDVWRERSEHAACFRAHE